MAWEIDQWKDVAIGLVSAIGVVLGGGKYIRSQRTETAQAGASVAASKADQSASESVAREVARLSVLVKDYGEKIQELSNQVQGLKEELGRLHNGRTTALKLLRKIKLCGECDTKFGVLLETAIVSLEDDDETSSSGINHGIILQGE